MSLIGLRDSLQTRHAIPRNCPLIGHLRYLLECVRPGIRQYFIQSDVRADGFEWINHSLASTTIEASGFRVTIRAHRAQPTRPVH